MRHNNQYRKEIAEIARLLGMPKRSRTVRNLYLGKIDKEDAYRIAERCRYRHTKTNYDSLLNHGFTKKEARKKMEETP